MLGGCVTCKDLEGLDETLTSSCKVNSSKFDIFRDICVDIFV